MHKAFQYLPFVCVLRVNLLGPDNARKHLDTPGVLKDSLNLVNLHSKGIAEAALNAKRDFIQEVVALRNPFVCDVNHGQVRILKVAVVWIFRMFAE